jgi:hypothetical protein
MLLVLMKMIVTQRNAANALQKISHFFLLLAIPVSTVKQI